MPTTDPTILFVKPKAVSAKDKRALQSAGVIVVEIEDVNNVKLIRAHAELSGSELLICAAKALTKSGESSNVHLANFGAAVSLALQSKAKPQ